MDGCLSLRHDVVINFQWLNISHPHAHTHIRIWAIFKFIFTDTLEMGQRSALPGSLLMAPRPMEWWVLFSHQSPRSAGRVYRRPGERLAPGCAMERNKRGRVSVTVWRCVLAKCTFDVVDTGQCIDEILAPQMEPHRNNHALSARPISRQDGASSYTASLSRNVFGECCHDRAWVPIPMSLSIPGILSPR